MDCVALKQSASLPSPNLGNFMTPTLFAPRSFCHCPTMPSVPRDMADSPREKMACPWSSFRELTDSLKYPFFTISSRLSYQPVYLASERTVPCATASTHSPSESRYCNSMLAKNQAPP